MPVSTDFAPVPERGIDHDSDGSRADILRTLTDVRFVPKAEIGAVFIRLVRQPVTSMMQGSSDQEPLRSSD